MLEGVLEGMLDMLDGMLHGRFDGMFSNMAREVLVERVGVGVVLEEVRVCGVLRWSGLTMLTAVHISVD